MNKGKWILCLNSSHPVIKYCADGSADCPLCAALAVIERLAEARQFEALSIAKFERLLDAQEESQGQDSSRYED